LLQFSLGRNVHGLGSAALIELAEAKESRCKRDAGNNHSGLVHKKSRRNNGTTDRAGCA
jgi:hypothetical protein